jgi:hypothetical protein
MGQLPEGLSRPARKWVAKLLEEYEWEPHNYQLLVMAAQVWDRREQVRKAIRQLGPVFTDRYGQPRSRPEVGIERDCTITFARLLREIGLSREPADDERMPGLLGGPRRAS